MHPCSTSLFTFTRELKWAGLLLGVSLSGFFDGIVLHQLLQWHHLLSAVNAEPWRDLRMQILADGLFHLLMYVLAAAGLALLWRARRNFALDKADRYLFAYSFIGFGVWNILDAVIFHWITRIHHIKMDAPNPLLWDLAWFFVFGVLFVVIGYLLKRGLGKAGGSSSSGQTRAAGASLAALVIILGLGAALPPGVSQDAVVVFRPGVSPAQAFNAIGQVNGKVMWADGGGAVWAIKLDRPEDGQALYRRGALLVSNSGFSLGCVSWSSWPKPMGA
ncbi:MAG: hypothetical protein JWR60_2192 [Polaromonas sp.]|nr:hypothetical protein [Polaromonas sp.]